MAAASSAGKPMNSRYVPDRAAIGGERRPLAVQAGKANLQLSARQSNCDDQKRYHF
jgi:hypothetical protein